METTIGMLIADGVGIVAGVMLCKRIPQRKIKWFSAIIFVLFGLISKYEVLSVKIGLGYTSLFLSILAVVSIYAMFAILSGKNQLLISRFGKKLLEFNL